MSLIETVFLFDLDGTLIDTVYQHVLAWREALAAEGIDLSVWRIHRKIGMSGGLFSSMLLRETGYHIDAARIEQLRRLHAAAFNRTAQDIQPLPGARELLAYLTNVGIPWAIATSGRSEVARPLLDRIDVDGDRIPIVTRDQAESTPRRQTDPPPASPAPHHANRATVAASSSRAPHPPLLPTQLFALVN